MTQELRTIVEAEMPTAKCARLSAECHGRLTVEHPFGRVVQERWLFIYLCYHHHLGKGYNKEMNQYLAYAQASDGEMKRTFPKTSESHQTKKRWLTEKYGNTDFRH